MPIIWESFKSLLQEVVVEEESSNRTTTSEPFILVILMAVLTPVELDFLQGRREFKVAAAIH
jgi:hypothetical protein